MPVISVGNLAVGGTGKTPLVRLVARWLEQDGVRGAILSRGYARPEATPGILRVSHGGRMEAMRWQLAGDEPWMLAKSLPATSVYVGRDRVESARRACLEGAQSVLLDDGFQHLALARDLDIVCLRGDELRARVLPAGPLREPPGALSHAGVVIRIQAWGREDSEGHQQHDEMARPWKQFLGPDTLWLEAELQPSRVRMPEGADEPPGILRGRSVGILSGIARPRRFAEMVASLGAKLEAYHVREDHHVFDTRELGLLREDILWVTTEKDAVRLPPDFSVAILHVDLEFRGGPGQLRERVASVCRKGRPA